MADRAEIGVFGGSGFYSLLEDVREVKVDTPYGAPSDSYFLAEVAFVDDGAPERRELLAQARDAEGGRAHVDAAPAAAEIEGYADQVDRSHRTL